MDNEFEIEPLTALEYERWVSWVRLRKLPYIIPMEIVTHTWVLKKTNTNVGTSDND
jgi:hypothetical protein